MAGVHPQLLKPPVNVADSLSFRVLKPQPQSVVSPIRSLTLSVAQNPMATRKPYHIFFGNDERNDAKGDDAKGDNSTDNQIFEIDLQPSMAEMAPDPIDSGLGFPLPRRMVSRSRFNS